MRLFEEANPARDLVGDAAPGKLKLQLDRVIMRAIEDCDLVQLDPFIAQLEDALSDEPRLLAAVVEGDHRRPSRVRWASRAELLAKLLHVG